MKKQNDINYRPYLTIIFLTLIVVCITLLYIINTIEGVYGNDKKCKFNIHGVNKMIDKGDISIILNNGAIEINQNETRIKEIYCIWDNFLGNNITRCEVNYNERNKQ